MRTCPCSLSRVAFRSSVFGVPAGPKDPELWGLAARARHAFSLGIPDQPPERLPEQRLRLEEPGPADRVEQEREVVDLGSM